MRKLCEDRRSLATCVPHLARSLAHIMLAVAIALPAYTLPTISPRAASSVTRCALPAMADGSPYTVGVLAIQGGFAEHMDALGHIDEHVAQALDHSLDTNTGTADIDALELVLGAGDKVPAGFTGIVRPSFSEQCWGVIERWTPLVVDTATYAVVALAITAVWSVQLPTAAAADTTCTLARRRRRTN